MSVRVAVTAVLVLVAPLQRAVVGAWLEYADFTQVSQLQALGSLTAGRVVGVSRHRRQVAAQVAEILREGTASFLLYHHQQYRMQID